jgi:hypothetical protein
MHAALMYSMMQGGCMEELQAIALGCTYRDASVQHKALCPGQPDQQQQQHDNGYQQAQNLPVTWCKRCKTETHRHGPCLSRRLPAKATHAGRCAMHSATCQPLKASCRTTQGKKQLHQPGPTSELRTLPPPPHPKIKSCKQNRPQAS